MPTLAEKCLNHRSVATTLNKYAYKLSRYLPASMDFDDARQELVVGLIKRLSLFRPDRGRLDVFASYVIRTLTWNMIRTKRFWTHEQTALLLEETLIDLVESRLQNRVVDKLICDRIEKNLDGQAKQVFSYLRKGISQAGCAELMGVSRVYISNLFKRKVRRMVNTSSDF